MHTPILYRDIKESSQAWFSLAVEEVPLLHFIFILKKPNFETSKYRKNKFSIYFTLNYSKREPSL